MKRESISTRIREKRSRENARMNAYEKNERNEKNKKQE